jgi:hypothetical protein
MNRQVFELVPLTQAEAKAFVAQHHRHHRPPVGSLFQIGLSSNGEVCGVVIVGRPVARLLQDGWTAEVLRLCTNGTPNACSKLYAAAWRAAQSLGWKRLITYILDTENGASIKAAGWRCIGKAGGGVWSRTDRPRVDCHPLQGKLRFEIGVHEQDRLRRLSGRDEGLDG